MLQLNDWAAIQLETRCEQSGKISYLNRTEAAVALANAKAEGRSERGFYRCPQPCRMWHLTHKSFKAWR